jgi:hypothetical protein
MLTGPETGGDTLWSSGYALYSSLSSGFQAYLEGLSAVHSAIEVARATGSHVRREPIDCTPGRTCAPGHWLEERLRQSRWVCPLIPNHPIGSCHNSRMTNDYRLLDLCMCVLHVMDRLDAANSRRSKGGVRRGPRVSL